MQEGVGWPLAKTVTPIGAACRVPSLAYTQAHPGAAAKKVPAGKRKSGASAEPFANQETIAETSVKNFCPRYWKLPCAANCRSSPLGTEVVVAAGQAVALGVGLAVAVEVGVGDADGVAVGVNSLPRQTTICCSTKGVGVGAMIVLLPLLPQAWASSAKVATKSKEQGERFDRGSIASPTFTMDRPLSIEKEARPDRFLRALAPWRPWDEHRNDAERQPQLAPGCGPSPSAAGRMAGR